jgi:hypothetical protein
MYLEVEISSFLEPGALSSTIVTIILCDAVAQNLLPTIVTFPRSCHVSWHWSHNDLKSPSKTLDPNLDPLGVIFSQSGYQMTHACH